MTKFTLRKIFLSFIYLSVSTYVFAQDTAAVAQADREATGMRADGKIYVVIAVLVTILCGLFIYLIRLDQKITRIEKGPAQK